MTNLINILKVCIDPFFSSAHKSLAVLGTLFYSLILINQRYMIEKTYRDVYLSENKIKCELKKINDILSILVPGFVKDLFLQGILII